MLSQPFLLFITFVYILGLVAVAFWADRRRNLQRGIHPYIYSLALAVYCSSWTYFGAVGSAAADAWGYMSIYAGPLLLFALGRPVIRKLARVGAHQKTTSLADFIGTRYGKRQLLAAVVSIVAVVGSMPYIALQLKAVSLAWNTLAESATAQPQSAYNFDTALVTALFLAVFAMLFGTRHIESRERNHGMMAALAVESVVKLLALLVIAAFGLWVAVGSYSANPGLASTVVAPWVSNPFDQHFFTTFILSVLAIVCLPRQFHVTVVEYQDDRDIKVASWVFPLYLLMIIAVVVPIAIAGEQLYLGTGIEPDTYVLHLPMDAGHEYLTLFGFLGGFSAATGMAIVAAVTLSIMVSNEIILPVLLRWGAGRFSQAVFLGRYLHWMRRFCIFLLLLAAWLMYHLIIHFEGLASIGLISFACFAQLSPALLAAIYWKKAHANGVYAGLAVGFSGWFYCLLLPAFFPAESAFLTEGPWSIAWLRPQSLFGVSFLEPVTHGVLWSLLPNLVIFVTVSALSKPSAKDALQASAFVSKPDAGDSDLESVELSTLPVRNLRILLDSFVSLEQQQILWRDAESKYRQRLLDDDRAPLFVVREVEDALSGVVGAASAQRAIELLGRFGPLEFKDIADIVGGTSKQLQFNEDLLQVTIETISQGISVVDADLRLVAWNRQYEELFQYPPRLLYVGCPIEDVYEYNAKRGMYRDRGDIKQQIQRRLQLLKSGGSHQFERMLPNGTTVKVIGNPMSSGGFVTTYIDVSDYKAVVSQLEDAKHTLEDRVRQRTQDLQLLNVELEKENQLRAEAEQEIREIHLSKSKFMQAASHDLLQPISAAKLFVASLQQPDIESSQRDMQVSYIGKSLETAEQLISSLREIARLESGKMLPSFEHFELQSVLQPLAAEFGVLAGQKSLAFRSVGTRLWVNSDPHLVRRILQNFLSNAIHYTRRGRVLLGCRRRAGKLSIEVWDTGPGITDEAMARIFNEFERLSPGATSTDKGLGLGLTIAQRMAGLLEQEIKVRSVPGQGSVFSIELPISDPHDAAQIAGERFCPTVELTSLRVLCVDNEEQILRGMESLLKQWDCDVRLAQNSEQMEVLYDQPRPDILLVDFHLEEQLTGLQLLDTLPDSWRDCPCIIISADTSDDTRRAVANAGYQYMAKPIEPDNLAEKIITAINRHKSSVSGGSR